VPLRGLGMSPRGPRTRPSFPTSPIMSGVATMTSTSIHPSFSFLIHSSDPAKSAPASFASRSLSPLVSTSTRTDFPVPWGRTTVPRTCCSAWRGSTPRRIDTSTVSSNFAVADFLSRETASLRSASLSAPTVCWAVRNRFPIRMRAP